jgi:ADP-heptose:LPS heptosyltransferase
LTDWAETAALVSALDIVITIDTGVAHLAGALGKPVLILLSHIPDWRWMLERSDSPWYPTARLYRQPAIGDWASPLGQVRSDLEKQVQNSR